MIPMVISPGWRLSVGTADGLILMKGGSSGSAQMTCRLLPNQRLILSMRHNYPARGFYTLSLTRATAAVSSIGKTAARQDRQRSPSRPFARRRRPERARLGRRLKRVGLRNNITDHAPRLPVKDLGTFFLDGGKARYARAKLPRKTNLPRSFSPAVMAGAKGACGATVASEGKPQPCSARVRPAPALPGPGPRRSRPSAGGVSPVSAAGTGLTPGAA
jgi:hypothetical protein